MKLTRIGLAIILPLVLMALICPAVQASEGSDDVDLEATVPLTISDVSDSSIGYYGATISWKTNGDATSQVFYDTAFHDDIADYADHTAEETTLITEHAFPLTGLSLGTTYHYRVRSAIPDTEFITISEDRTFTTLSPAPVVTPPTPPAPPPGTTDVSGVVTTAGVFLEPVTATSEDELCTLNVPEGTVGLTEELEPIDEITVLVMDEPPPPPEDARVVGLAYDFGPDGATFEPPITLTFSYDPEALPEGVAEEDLVLAYYDEDTGEWVELDGVVDTENNTITASVPHFTTFAIIGAVTPPVLPVLEPAAFTVSSLGISPSEVAPSEEINISVVVANTGGESGSYTVVLKIDGVKEAEERVTIAAGGSQYVSFSVTKEEAGSYTVAVDGLSGSFTVVPKEEVMIDEEEEVPPEAAAFSVASLSVTPLEVEPGETVTITALVANTGELTGSYEVTLKINNTLIDTKEVTLAGGASQTVTFTTFKNIDGVYTVSVDGLSGSFTVVPVVVPPAPPGINWALIGGIIGAVIVVGLVSFFLIRRRRAA